MGNAVGPVALIAAGIYLGYLTLAGKASALVAVLKGNAVTSTTTTGTTTTTTTAPLSTAAGSSTAGGLLPAGAVGTAAGMSQFQAANAALQSLQNYVPSPN